MASKMISKPELEMISLCDKLEGICGAHRFYEWYFENADVILDSYKRKSNESLRDFFNKVMIGYLRKEYRAAVSDFGIAKPLQNECSNKNKEDYSLSDKLNGSEADIQLSSSLKIAGDLVLKLLRQNYSKEEIIKLLYLAQDEVDRTYEQNNWTRRGKEYDLDVSYRRSYYLNQHLKEVRKKNSE